MFPHIKIRALHLGLRLSNSFRNKSQLYRLILRQIKFFHKPSDTLPPKNTQEIVLKRKKKLRRTWISLSPRASPQLIIYASCVVPLGADNVQSSQFTHFLSLLRSRRVTPQKNVHATASKVSRNRYRSAPPGLRDNRAFTLVIFRIQYFVWHVRFGEQRR